MLKIGNVTLSSPIMLAPLAGISDLPFRIINRSFGCEFAFVEMISARALVNQNKETIEMLSTIPADRPLGVQLLGNDPEVLRRALDMLRAYEFDIVDFNAACPVNKVASRGEGACLLKAPHKLKELLKAMVANSDVPVTVKIRAGWDDTSVNARDVALHAQDAGVKALIVHGRTREQGYRGRVDYNIIREIKEALEIPVVASGDALSPQLIRKMFDETGCDGVTIARGALGNPWIFRETVEFLRSGKMIQRPDICEIINTIIAHLNLCIEYHGETDGIKIFRKFLVWYTKGFPGIRMLRNKAFRAKTKAEMMDIIGELRAAEENIICCSGV